MEVTVQAEGRQTGGLGDHSVKSKGIDMEIKPEEGKNKNVDQSFDFTDKFG